MKKHNLFMVFLLILTLSLVGAVSAGDNVTVCDDAPVLESSGENQMEVAGVCEISEVSFENENSDIISQSEDCCQEVLSADGQEDVCTQKLDGNYEFGYEVAQDFTNNVNIEDKDVLVISNAGISDINNQTTESVLNGIIDASNGYITYEDGNLLSLSSTADSVYLAFFVKNDESFTIALYQNDAAPLYYGNVSTRMSVGHLEKLKLCDVETASILYIIDSWINGDLNELDTSQVLLGGKDKLQTVKYYPHEFDLPPFDVLGVSGDFDDDAFILEKSNSSDEKASFDVSMVGKSMDESSSLNLYQIGVDASNDAISYLNSQGVDIPNDYPHLYVLTSADHVKVDGLKTDKVLDGILDALGPKFNEKHLISVDDPSWKDLVFYFIVVKNTKYTSYALKYDSDNGDLIKSDKAKEHGDNMAKKMGLISANHKYHGSSKNSHGIFSSVYAGDLNQSSGVNITDNRTSDVNKTSEGNVTNISDNSNKSDKIVNVPKSNANPFNILYTLASILIVCVLFGRTYRNH